MFTVFKISSPTCNFVYYGYLHNINKVDDVVKKFITQSNRADNTTRGSTSWVVANDGRVDNIHAHIIETFEDEFEAWEYRNDIRCNDDESITGPSIWPIPGNNTEHSITNLQKWKHNNDIRNCKTARQAYQLGCWTFAQIKALSNLSTKQQISFDLDDLTPQAFAFKYGLTLGVKD